MRQRRERFLAPTGGEGKGEGGRSRGFARGLRRRQTDSERVLWWQLRDRQLHHAKFRRQHPIGPYIVDFCCLAHRLVVELDGGHHAAQIQADERRTAFLRQRGYRVLRFWDHDVLGNTPLPPGGRGQG